MNIDTLFISESLSILDAMSILNTTGYGIVLIGTKRILKAVLSDGDIRRHILKNGNLSDPVSLIANYSPLYVTEGHQIDLREYCIQHHIRALPIVTNKKEVLTVYSLYATKEDFPQIQTPVVIMAGGKGSRLYPYTEILPKPLIPIGEQTITEHIMDQFEAYGCTHFDMIVNYKKNLIRSFFLDNERKRDISFIEEDEFLGTGGGLKLLSNKYSESFFMSNCDILIKHDYSDIMKHHLDEHNIITIVAALKNITIPYGTIDISEQGNVITLKEKPSMSFMTNTGLYVIHPDFLKLIPDNTFIHITDVIQLCIDTNQKVGIYPISEGAWMDMGQISELMQMKERLEV